MTFNNLVNMDVPDVAPVTQNVDTNFTNLFKLPVWPDRSDESVRTGLTCHSGEETGTTVLVKELNVKSIY